MPIHERDPWRTQYFDRIACPADVRVPTDDLDAYRWNPRHRWIYNKLLIAESQGLDCAPHGIEPPHYPVFSKPTFNLKGMGVGSRPLHSRAEYLAWEQPGSMWMPLLTGEHVSTDVAVVHGRVRWCRHTLGLAAAGGTFDYWTVEARARPMLDAYCTAWVEGRLPDYTGMLNLESIGGTIIEAHLRFADQWPDLYGPGWIDAVVGLYAGGRWDYADLHRRDGYSVVLFGPHAHQYRHPPPALLAEIRGHAQISSVQITFDADKAAGDHAMPPGGFRLAILNTPDLAAGRHWRDRLAAAFGVDCRGVADPLPTVELQQASALDHRRL